MERGERGREGEREREREGERERGGRDRVRVGEVGERGEGEGAEIGLGGG